MTNSSIQAGPRGGGAKTVPSPTARAAAGRRVGVVVCLIIILAGVALFWAVSIRPALRVRAAIASWTKVPCTILSSNVDEHPGSGDEGTTYSVNVRYAYTVAGRRYESSRFNFFSVSTAGRDDNRAIVRRYSRGSTAACYVNPTDPADAVLEPNLGGRGWLLILPPAFVMLFGMVGLVATLRSGRRAARVGVSNSRISGVLPVASNETRTLRPTQRPFAGFVLRLIFALVFDGALVAFVWHLSSGHVSGLACAALFLLFWAAACVALTAAAVHAGLALFNPRATVTLARGAVPPGGSAELQWTFDGRYDRVQRLTLRLEGSERATYRQGTDTRTDTNVFATVPLFETDRNDLMVRGKCILHVPAGAMHTFRAAHNEIRWLLVLHGQIPHWPDVKSEFEIEVPPPAIQPAAPSEKPPALPAESAARPDSFVAIRTTDGRAAFSPGEPIAGIVTWSLPAIPKRVELRLFWFTRGKGTEDAQIVEQVAIDNPPIQGQHPFMFRAPNGPYSFSGKLISLIWGLEVLAEPKDRSDRIEIVCAPGGREIVPAPAVPGGRETRVE
jgi:hypothetical protein